MDRLVDLAVKASASRAEDPGSESRLPVMCVIGSALELVGPVSVYCDWVRWRVGSATSISVRQHVNLSRSAPEIHLHVAGTLSNQQTLVVFMKPEHSWFASLMFFVCNMGFPATKITFVFRRQAFCASPLAAPPPNTRPSPFFIYFFIIIFSLLLLAITGNPTT